MNLYFTNKIRDWLDLSNTPMGLKTCLKGIATLEGVFASDEFQN